MRFLLIRRHAVLLLVTSFLLLPLTACHRMKAYAEPFTAQSDLALLSEKGVLPRNINLKTFDPHRAEFKCARADVRLSAPSQEAQTLFERGLALTSPALWPKERNWPQAMALWDQAAAQGHWKAALMWLQNARTGAGVNSPKGQFAVEASDAELVVSRTETLMRQGVPDAFFTMGVYHDEGYGVKFSTDRAWAFWELAADMGSARAQTKIAKSLNYGEGAEALKYGGVWANEKVAYEMFECAASQGNGEAGYRLGLSMDMDSRSPLEKNRDVKSRRALQILHDAVKFGSEDAANYLASSLRAGDPISPNGVDIVRGDRYSALGDALFNNPDLRFPSLDRVLPLPPAKLPQWDGKPDSLINAAKGVREPPKPAKAQHHPQSRAHVPEGHVLAVPAHMERFARMEPLPGYTSILYPGDDRPMGLMRACATGYWQAQPIPPQGEVSPYMASLYRDFAKLPPLHFQEGEAMQLRRPITDTPYDDAEHGLVEWRFAGIAVKQPDWLLTDWLVKVGTLRAIDHAQDAGCASGQPCPASGIWQPHVLNSQHPLAKMFGDSRLGEGWKFQSFVRQGEIIPALAMANDQQTAKVKWRLMQACEAGFEV